MLNIHLLHRLLGEGPGKNWEIHLSVLSWDHSIVIRKKIKGSTGRFHSIRFRMELNSY